MQKKEHHNSEILVHKTITSILNSKLEAMEKCVAAAMPNQIESCKYTINTLERIKKL
jgi:hypothetical protein